jgi:hypothetical protein
MPNEPQFGAQPTNLDFEKSLMFFHAYMYGPVQGKLRLYGARNIPAGPVAMSSDWEVFASMLVNDLGRKFGAGIDLVNYEVKSAKRGGGYEYQYHKIRGREDLARHPQVGHLFFEYSDNLNKVDLRYLHGSQLAGFFKEWLDKFPDPYRQRYRRSVPYGYVKEHGTLLMTLKNGEVAYPPTASQDASPSSDGEEEEDSEPLEE